MDGANAHAVAKEKLISRKFVWIYGSVVSVAMFASMSLLAAAVYIH